jgi:NO-binding membrane sensor protein with MHYT domain
MTLSNYFALNVDPSQALPETYNYGLVLLSYLVAVLGSYAFLQFASRIAELRDAGLRYSWLVIGAIAMGGGIWAMHFIGMLAHILPIPVAYDPWVTHSPSCPPSWARAWPCTSSPGRSSPPAAC